MTDPGDSEESERNEEETPEPPDDEGREGEADSSPPARSTSNLPARVRMAAPVVARKGSLAAGLAWLGVSTALPLILVTWLFGLLIGALAIAKGLEETDGLVHTTFGAGYVVGAVTVVGLLLGTLALRLFGSKESRTLRRIVARPFAVPAATLLTAALFSFAVEDGGTDLPDILTTAALLGLWDFVLFLLPIWLALGAIDAARKTFSWAGEGPYRSGFVTGLAMAGGLLLPTATLLLATHAESDLDLDPEIEALFDRVDRVRETGNVIHDTHAVFVAIAQPQGIAARAKLPPPQPTREVVRTPFEECAEDLAEANSGQKSERDLAIGRLVRDGHRREDAEDVAQLTIVIVCLKYERGEVREYVPYFVRSVGRNAAKRSSRDRLVACDPSDFYDLQTWSMPAGGSEFQDHERAFCGLDESNKKLILAAAAGYTGEELAGQLGVSPAAARQRLSRARAALLAGM